METNLLNPEIQQFIDASIGSDVNTLALKKNPFPNTDWKTILNQIAAKTKAKNKLPTWYGAKNILWPEKVSVEQTSSEITAAYKSNLVSGKSLIDLSGGFGVDDYYFSKKLESVIHCEINDELSQIAQHNFEQLNSRNIECFTGDGIEILQKTNRKFDWIYIDPSRRHDAKGKVFLLKDCVPDVPGNLAMYFNFAFNILVKVSPLLDIAAGLSELKNVKTIYIVAVKNEVKELLWMLEKGYYGRIDIQAVDLANDTQREFKFILGETADVVYSKPLKYLFEPNAAVMKSGGFDQVSAQFKIGKLHKHSHLYTSDELLPDFCGRTFEVLAVLPYNKTALKQLTGTKANVTTRNFHEPVETLRKKWKIADGGQQFYFFTTDTDNEKIVLLCAKI